MEEKLKTISRLVQKRTKGSELRFQILPPKNTDKENSENNKKESSL